MAAAYAKALAAWDGKIEPSVRLNQRGWVGSRDLLPPGMDQGGVYCTDDATRLPCLRGFYRDRIAGLSDPAWRLGGVYEGARTTSCASRSSPAGWSSPPSSAARLSAGIHPGGGADQGRRRRDPRGFPLTGAGRDACRLTADFIAEALILAQQGPCGGQALSGRWTRNQARDPEAELF